MEFLLSNPSFFFTALAVVLSIFTISLLKWKLSNKKYPPIAGTVLHQLHNFNRVHDYMTDLAGKHKTYRLLAPFRSEIYTSDPTNVEYILKSNFDNYGKGGYNYNILRDLLGDGIFAVDGEKWRQQRKISSHEFSTRKLRDFSSLIFQKSAAKLAHMMSEIASSNQTIEIQDVFMKSALDTIFQVSFGVELDNMCESSEEGKNFGDAFDNSSALTLFRYVDVLWGIKKFMNVGSEAILRKNTKIVDEFVYKLIHKKLEQMEKKDDSSDAMEREDILSRFLRVSQTNPTYLRDIILNLIIAGKDTTASTLSWFFYLLCRHPSVQERIQQEVEQVTGMKKITNFFEFASSLREDVLEKMQYLHAAITETLRIYPAVPVDGKICFSDDTLPDGFSVRKGTLVAYQPYAMGRMKALWGEDAEQFKPERWLDENGVFQPESPFKFTAFQAGPRICLGKEFAYRQMKILSAVLLSCFVFKMSDENRVVTYRTMITLHIDEGLEVQVLQR
ncbi:cytochrome P450 704C1-like [Argentina anserina]|uniref:cytochrome P450 704C1-like n=1 Tax=Argentina anserina TaxID=57926 RepID=UPI0021763A99|nr:cytochrome P450 704C1-like [Potentilla anserina]